MTTSSVGMLYEWAPVADTSSLLYEWAPVGAPVSIPDPS